jgi:hypothetical protein
MPAKRIIILEQSDAQTYRFALWADVPVPRQPFYANPAAVSAWSGAAAGDNTALKNGSVVESTGTINVPIGEALAPSQARLIALWTAYQAAVTSGNQWARYGSFWDGTTWTPSGVA